MPSCFTNFISQLILFGTLFLNFPLNNAVEPVTINAPAGNCEGRRFKDVAEKVIYSFYSIPYANTSSKFSKSSISNSGTNANGGGSKSDYSGKSIINKYFPTFCMNHYFLQNFRENENMIISQKCLFLDIFTQERFMEYGAVLAPVIVIFDDPKADFESYVLNKLSLVTHLATYTNSLIVRVNYRNGAHGFLYLDEEHFPGNYGLVDQRNALMWIRKNIYHFGGDNTKITVLGQGLGSVGMGWHLEHSQKLFSNMVLLSGSPFNLFASWDPKLLKSLHHSFISSFNCEKFKSVRYCIEELTDDQIYSVDKIKGLPAHLFFLPHHDIESFLHQESKKTPKFLSGVDIMVGYQKWDGYVLYDDILDDNNFSFLSLVNLSLPEDLLKIVAFEYSHHHISVEHPTEEDFNAFMTDYFVISPQYKFASMISKNLHSNVYMFTVDIPLEDDQAESDASAKEKGDFLGSSLLESTTMRERFSQFIRDDRDGQSSKSQMSSKQSAGLDGSSGYLSGAKTSSNSATGNQIWKPINFPVNQNHATSAAHSCQVLELIKSNKTGYTALFVNKNECEPHFSHFWNVVVFQNLQEVIDQGQEKDFDKEYNEEANVTEMSDIVNVATEGLNETEAPPVEEEEEEKREEKNDDEESSESQEDDDDDDSYQSQLKNLQVSLRLEKASQQLRFTVTMVALGLAIVVTISMCLLLCYCSGCRKRAEKNRNSQNSSACKGCSTLMRSHRSFRSDFGPTPSTLPNRDSMCQRYDVITPLHGFPPATGEEAYQMAKLDRYQAERSTPTTPTLMRSANTYCGPNDCDVTMRQSSCSCSSQERRRRSDS